MLTNPTGGVLVGWPNRITILLADSREVKSFNCEQASRVWGRHSNWGRFSCRVWRTGGTDDTNNPAAVDYHIEPGSAQPGVDYTPVSGTLSFVPYGYADIVVPILTNHLARGDRDFRIVLSNPTPGYVLGTKETTVTIQEDDFGFTLETGWARGAACEVPENAGQALVDVVILGDATTRPVSVDYRTQLMSAIPVQDYMPVSGTLTFTAGESRKTIAIPIINDSRKEPTKSFKLLLEIRTGGMPLSLVARTGDSHSR